MHYAISHIFIARAAKQRVKMSRKSVGVMQCYWFVNNREAKNANHLAWKFIQHFFIHLFLLTLCTHNSRSHGWLNSFMACTLDTTSHSLSLPFNLNKTRLSISYLNNADPNHIIESLWRDFCDRKLSKKENILHIFFLCTTTTHARYTPYHRVSMSTLQTQLKNGCRSSSKNLVYYK